MLCEETQFGVSGQDDSIPFFTPKLPYLPEVHPKIIIKSINAEILILFFRPEKTKYILPVLFINI